MFALRLMLAAILFDPLAESGGGGTPAAPAADPAAGDPGAGDGGGSGDEGDEGDEGDGDEGDEGDGDPGDDDDEGDGDGDGSGDEDPGELSVEAQIEYWRNMALGKKPAADAGKPADGQPAAAPENSAAPSAAASAFFEEGEYAQLFEGPEAAQAVLSKAVDRKLKAFMPDIAELAWRSAVQAFELGYETTEFFRKNPDLAEAKDFVLRVSNDIRAEKPGITLKDLHAEIRKQIPKGVLKKASQAAAHEDPAAGAGFAPSRGSRTPAPVPGKRGSDNALVEMFRHGHQMPRALARK